MSAARTSKRTMEWVLHERAATLDQYRRLSECLAAGRHASHAGVTMAVQLQALDAIEVGASGTLRYCSNCWSIFGPDGKIFMPRAGGATPGLFPSTRSEET